MHASIEQLLNLRDTGAEAEAVVSHVAACEACQAELGRLCVVQAGLQRLPDFEVPDGSWEMISKATTASAPDAGRPRLTGWFWTGSLAAGLAVAVVLYGLLGQAPGESGQQLQADISSTTPTLVSQSAPVQAVTVPDQQDLAGLMAQSRHLEWALSAMPAGPQVVSADTAGTISVLEDRVAMIDYRLSMTEDPGLSSEQELKLWKERVGLMNSLVQVRYAQAQSASF
jgi:hypothetical protein